ncbi:AAA family ATPase [Streptomyces sp. NPDC006208]|uniref:AAA family ATPase n=1 Tax=Streptomyces sp. NPDC006208 TaxID=3156734 RepID=UPI0033AD747B
MRNHGKILQHDVLLGRDNELAALVARVSAARRGDTGCAILTAPSGFGKSVLLDSLLRTPGCWGMTVLRGHCGEAAGGAGAYSGLRALFAATGTPATHREETDGGAGHPAEFLPGPGGTQRFSLPTAYPVFRRLHRHALRLMAHRPLILALDDAHDCDEHSLRWLDFILRRAAGHPLLVLLARRSEARLRAPEAWAGLLAQPAMSLLHLGALGTDTVGSLAEQVFGTPVHPRLARDVAAVTGGNPRTAVRLLRELRRRGAGPDEAGARQAVELGARMGARSVRRVLARERADLRSAAAAVALLGTEPLKYIAVLADVDRGSAEEAVTVLRHAGALSPDGAEVVHDAVRDALLESLSVSQRAELHARAALLLSDAGSPADQVARHLVELPQVHEPWMAAVLRDAAAWAEQRGAFSDAAGFLRRALEAEPDDAEARLRLALAVTPTDPLAAAALFRTALADAADTAARASIAVQYAMACLTVPLPASHRAELLEALEAARDTLTNDSQTDVQLRDQVAAVLLLMGRRRTDTAGRQPHGPVTAPHQVRTGLSDPLQTAALGALHDALSGHSRERAVRDVRRVLVAAPKQPLWLQLAAATTLALADETADAHAALDTVLRRTADEPASWTRVLALTTRSTLLRRDGAFFDATAAARVAIDTVGESGSDAWMRQARAVLASALVDQGEPQRAERLLDGISRAEPSSSAIENQLYLYARARARWAAGHPAQALRLLRECGWAQEAAGVVNPVVTPWWAEACLILAAMRHPADGRELADQGAERARRWGTPRALGLAALARGVLTRGRAGVDLLAESVHHLSRSPAVAECARAEYALGRALLLHGDETAARNRLRRAAGLAGGCGALALAESARNLLVSAGGRMAGATGTSTGGLLTTTELKVAGLAVSGASNRQIAQRLFVTVRTVESHLTNVYRKLGVRRREGLGLALRAVQGRSMQLPGASVLEGT